MNTMNPQITDFARSGKTCLKFTFTGTLKKEDAFQAIEKWKTFFKSKPNERITLIWECHAMKGYDTESRIAWQNALNDCKPQIESIWLITKSRLIKLGAQIMTVFTSLNIKVVESEDQIQFTTAK